MTGTRKAVIVYMAVYTDKMLPEFDAMVTAYPDIVGEHVNIIDYKGSTLRAIPTIFFIRDGVEEGHVDGWIPAEVEAGLARLAA